MKHALTILRSLLLGLFLSTVSAGILYGGAVYDYDGDGRTDLIVSRNNGYGNEYTWLVSRSSDGQVYAPNLGIATNGSARFGDTSCMGDYDGDGKWDITIVRYESARRRMTWHILNSSDGTLSSRRWPGTYDPGSLFPQDYDGDGKTDLALYRDPGNWEILRSSDGVFTTEFLTGGGAGLSPFMGGDYDGDRKADLAESYYVGGGRYLHIKFSATGQTGVYYLGTPPSTGVVAGDFDGDGKADVAGWYGAIWRWIRSSDGQIDSSRIPVGMNSTTRAAPGDYDGDGKTDVAFIKGYENQNPGPNYFFMIQQSRDGFIERPWGLLTTDSPLFDRRSLTASGARPANQTPSQIKEAVRLPRLVSGKR